jgi:hypothetical protein
VRSPPEGRRPLGRGRSPSVRNAQSVNRGKVTEEDFHAVDGWPYAGCGVRQCIGCGAPEPRRSLRVREANGVVGWLPVPEAVVRGGR